MKNFIQTSLLGVAICLATVTKAQVPLLSSNPSSNSVIYLDFDGQTVDGTSWNTAGPLFLDAANLSTADITTIFERVSEDYRPFNVNVTTDSTVFWAGNKNSRMRVILTPTHEWYGNSGGVSFVGSFTWGAYDDETPCFVFSSLLGNIKYIAEAASHEAGHTLGLYHQSLYDNTCTKISEYNSGVGTGEIAWAPIMGVGYYRNMTLWNNGPNPYGCSNYQNDLDVITTSNGFTYRTDDYANNFSGAATATFTNNIFSINGIIEQNTDADYFKFIQPAFGRFQLNAVPYNVGASNAGSDLDLQVSLYNSAHTLIDTYNPGNLLSSVIDTALLAGTYYLKVEGEGNIYAPNYASLGSYSLTGKFNSNPTLPLRRLELTGALINDNHKLSWIIDADEAVVSQVLEIATDGRHFSPVTTPATTDRQFMYKPYVSTAAQYRLNVTFDNGKQYYSNIVTLQGTGAVVKPRLVRNVVDNGLLSVNSPGEYQYRIMDMNGHVVNRGQINIGLNTISTPAIAGGMYMIEYTNGMAHWIEKFVRQ